jgi:hypothetical protein
MGTKNKPKKFLIYESPERDDFKDKRKYTLALEFHNDCFIPGYRRGKFNF